MQKRLIQYENGDKLVWNGRAEIHYHKTKIMKEDDITHATFDEIVSLKKNPNNQKLISSIQERKNVVR